VQRVLPKCDPVTKVTIVSRGMALGYTMSLPSEDRYLHSKTEFEDKIAGMLGGNVAETLVFGDTTTGSSNDIEKATGLARAMVTQYGMSEKLGPLAFGKKDEMVFLGREISEQRNYSDEVAAKIDSEVRAIIDNGFARAKAALTEHREVLDRLAALLVEKETIEHDEFEALFEGVLPPRSGGPTPRRMTVIPGADAVEPDIEPEAEEGGGSKRRRPGPAPQPA
jgi:cell division protease FtsH